MNANEITRCLGRSGLDQIDHDLICLRKTEKGGPTGEEGNSLPGVLSGK